LQEYADETKLPHMWNQRPVILVAEDDQNDAFLLRRTLKKVGILNPVQIVEDGAIALDYLRGNNEYKNRDEFPFPGVIITDLKMPKVDGFQILSWLKRHPECGVIPTVVLSASAMEGDVVKAYQAGANCYLQKPNSPAEFETMLKLLFEFWNLCKIPQLTSSECAEPNPPDKK
jgi:CheY-like chemotaxis protein